MFGSSPINHTYDGIIRKNGLDKDFRMNIEANHATLAGHTFQHELRVCAVEAMYEILKAGGLRGGLNFDSKNRRPSNTPEDMFYAFISGMDAFALGLIKAAAIIEDGRIEEFVKDRYSSYSDGIGKKIRDRSITLEEAAAHAAELKKPASPGSGRQEYLETVLNNILFG